MNDPALDCLCAGIVVADHICEPVDHVPVAGELVLTSRMELSVGGCAANVAVCLAKLGHRASVVGKVGADSFGQFVRHFLDAQGVGTEHLGESSTRDTSGTLVINTRGEDRRFIHSMGANGELTGEDISRKLICSARILYVGGYGVMDSLSPQSLAAAFQAARAAGVPTLLDVVIGKPGDHWSRLQPVLPYVDVFLPNDDEARAICGLNTPAEQARAFRAAGAKTVIVTCGKAGAVFAGDATVLQCDGYEIEFVDGTGSGDAFTAGYIHGLLTGADPISCLRYGSALGASCVRATGATSGVFSRTELEAFVKERQLAIRTM